jgi:DNA repair protein RecO (recombination protein O)
VPLVTTEAFVLRTYSLAEADKICVFLTRQMGKVRGVAHGARKLKSRFGSSLEPFTEVRLRYYQKENRELIHVSACDIIRSHFNRAARDVETAAAFSYMAELTGELVPEHEGHEGSEGNDRLYRLVGATLEAIEHGDDLSKALRYFETWLLKLGGFYPEPSQCSTCGDHVPAGESIFVTGEGSPRCGFCSGGRGLELRPQLRQTLGRIFSSHPTAFVAEPIAHEDLVRIGEINYQIIRHVLERDLRSKPVSAV